MKNIAVYSNDNEQSKDVILKLESLNIIEKGKMKPVHLNYMCYLLDKDIIVSPLCLEMHYPQYKSINTSEYLGM